MNQDIQQRIAQGSEDHVDKYGSGYNGINVGKVRKVDFTAGATFVLNTILPEFAEWLDSGPYVFFNQYKIWKDINSDESFTSQQLIELFKNRGNETKL